MMNNAKRFFSMLLVLAMVLSMAPMTVWAAPHDHAAEVKTENVVIGTTTEEKNTIDFSAAGFAAPMLQTAGVEVDETNPAIISMQAGLDEIKVLNADGTPTPLTEEQKQTILYLYQQYLDNWAANADVLGVQTPFFLAYNDTTDELGILGEMLVLAGIDLATVRAGYVSYDDITGMIQNFIYGDVLGVKFYGSAVTAARDEVLNLVNNSGAQTDAQKYMVINNWLAQNVTFDVPYIMNADKEEGEKPMVAEKPQKHENYDNVYNVIYADYEKSIRDTFEQQIRDGLQAEFKQQFYVAAIEAGYTSGVWTAVIEQFYIQGMTQQGMTEEEAKAAAAAQVEADAEAISADPYAYCVNAFGQEGADQAQAAVDSEVEKFMNDNAAAIEADPVAFVEAAFGADAAAQIAAQWDLFWADAQQNGVEVDPVNYPGYKMTVDEIVAQQMDTAMDDLQGMTPNQAIPVYAEQAALGLTQGVLDYWQGHHFGALGRGTAVCLGYTKAFTYIVQSMKSSIYKNGNTWKTAEELYYTNGKLDITKNYVVDSVRITFDTDVTMYGETQENFNSDHFWNAVQVDGKWYYIDPCYVDIYTSVMIRDRVETDGDMNYLYFMFSHNTTTSLYDGYYSEIKTLYADAATHTDYEDSWISRVKSNTYFNNNYVYYVYDSTDMVSMMDQFDDIQNSMNNGEEDVSLDMGATEYKIVRHKLDGNDLDAEGDTDYESLVEFNYYEETVDENGETVTAEESYARVKNSSGQLVKNDVLTALYEKHTEYTQIYPSIKIGCAFYNNKVYFNLANVIMCYDISSGTVTKVKEYNVVHGVRDDSNPFGGVAFTTTTANNADFTVENHPIASISLKGDGKLYVSIATNFAFISGKDPHNSADQSSFGYEFEETNYNPNYNSYSNSQMGSMGGEEETNDNDEFMWTANFVETLTMSHLAGSGSGNNWGGGMGGSGNSGSHSYETVTVEATCGQNAYTEDRCTTCGAIKADSRVEVEGTALDHHFIRFDETYYTKSNKKWNTGFCYVCTECYYAIEEPTEPDKNESYEDYGTSYEEQMEIYEQEKAEYDAAVASAGHTYAPTDAAWTEDSTSVTFQKLQCSASCAERAKLVDCLIDNDASGNKPINVTLKSTVTAEAAVTDYTGNCTQGATAIYTATGEAEGYTYTAVNEVSLKPGQHAYEATFEWTAVENGYTATADVTCAICGDAHQDVVAEVVLDKENTVAATCTEAGKNTYVATATITDANGNVIGTATQTKVDDLGKLPHDFKDGFCSVCGVPQMSVPTIKSCYSTVQDSVKVTWTVSEGASGYQIYRTTDPVNGEWKCIKTVKDGTKDRYTNQGLEVGTTYYYKVRAYAEDAEGNRTYTAFSDVNYMPAAVVFDGPYSNATFRIRLLWKEIGGAHGYQIWGQKADGSWKIVKTIGDKGNELTENKGGTTAYSNTGLIAGDTYTYKMRAFMITESGKKVFGAYSDVYSIAVKPEAPTVTVTSPKATRAQITWNEINGAAGYQVWMAESENGEYKIVKSVTDGSTSYTKYDLTSGKTYYFKVRAYAEAQGRKAFSAYSAIQSITVK